LFEEFGCKIDFAQARTLSSRFYIERENAEFRWKRDGYSIKELVRRGCYKTRAWQKGDNQGFVVKGRKEWVIYEARPSKKSARIVKRHKKMAGQSFEAFMVQFLSDSINLFTPKVSWPPQSEQLVVIA